MSTRYGMADKGSLAQEDAMPTDSGMLRCINSCVMFVYRLSPGDHNHTFHQVVGRVIILNRSRRVVSDGFTCSEFCPSPHNPLLVQPKDPLIANGLHSDFVTQVLQPDAVVRAADRCSGNDSILLERRIDQIQQSLQHITVSSNDVSVLRMDSQLAGCVTESVMQSPRFANGFLSYVGCHRRHKNLCKHGTVLRQLCFDAYNLNVEDIADTLLSCPIDADNSAILLSVRQAVVILLEYPHKLWLNYKWCYRLCDLVVKRMELDDAMNWLSTLGGAYSALGDYFEHHAVNAAKMSLKQLRIALEMGSPPVVIRCHLYYALSLLQTERLCAAKHSIWHEFIETKQLPVVDVQLIAMCHSLWNRLRYLRQKRRSARHQNTLS